MGMLVQREIKKDKNLTQGKERSNLGPCQNKRDDTEVGIHTGMGGTVSGGDDGIGGPDGETCGDDGVE